MLPSLLVAPAQTAWPSPFRPSKHRCRYIHRRVDLQVELPNWVQPVTTLSLVLAFIWSRALLGIPPRGRMPSLNAWLRRMPPRPKPLKPSLPKLPTAEGNEVPVSPLDTVQLRPATSLASIWEAYLFAGQFSTIPVALQLLEFPQAFLDWRRSDGLIPGLPNTPLAIDPIFSRKELPASEEDVVRACDEMLDSYGGILLAVIENGSQEELIGTLSVRVKWLPQACHTREDTEGHSLVVRTVPYAQVSSAMGLEPVAYLEQFAVATEWRGSGLSARILHRAEDMARRWGLGILTLHVQRDDWGPLRFYQKHGFEITSDWMGRGPQRFLLMKLL